MCGIVGRVNAARERPIDEDELRAATRLIVHRGPDGEGTFLDGNVGLGHRRLSIVDIALGAQPMANDDGTIQVVFNGEIYNHRELRAELAARGHRFATQSDTEVIVQGYLAWGELVTSRLRGMFAFALWDRRRRRMLVARDRVGIKPLYYACVGKDLVFASEIKSLFAFADVPRELDATEFPLYLALRYVPGPRTLFRGIQRLEPGHQLVWEDGKIVQTRFWDVPVRACERPTTSDEDAEANDFRELLVDTTRMHLMGEVPVGLFLSGGIDSTVIGWAMRQANPAALKSFSVGFDGDSEGELVYARLAAKALGTEHREVRVNAGMFHAGLADLAWHLDEPNSDGACIPLMYLARRAREEVVVVLSGEGADEILGGYGIYGRQLAIERARRLGGPAVGAATTLAKAVVRDPKLRKYLDMAGRPLEQRYFGVGRGFTDELLGRTFGEGARRALIDRFAPLWLRTRGAPDLHRLLYNDTKIWLPDDLLIKADKMTMNAAIELRVPFLDHLVLERAWRLPPSFKRREGVGKWLLRRAFAGRIPNEILHRSKKGFPVPIGRWLRAELHPALRETLLSSGSSARALLGAQVLERLLEEHRSGRADRTEELYALWVYEAWHHAFLSGGLSQKVKNELRRGPEAVLWSEPRVPEAWASAPVA